jgi:ankyrin repeat protein
MRWKLLAAIGIASAVLQAPPPSAAQVAPSSDEILRYRGLHAAAAAGDAETAALLIDRGAALEARDGHGRTALHVAGHRGHHALAQLLIRRGADPNALDSQRYDLVTIAAVIDDAEMVRLALAGGARAANVTSPYAGTALIAAAHLGHVEPVRALIAAGAPLDHVNNLGWTALLEAILLGDGGRRHTEIVRRLVEAGANVDLADREGVTPLAHAERRGYPAIVLILESAGASD